MKLKVLSKLVAQQVVCVLLFVLLTGTLALGDELQQNATGFKCIKGDGCKLASPVTLRIPQDFFSQELIDKSTLFFTKQDTLNVSISELENLSLVAASHSYVYQTIFTHRYDNHQELMESGGPHANNELCLSQLEELVGRVEQAYKEKTASKDLELYRYMDTFEWYSPGSLLIKFEWPGDYTECLKRKINLTGGVMSTRYCSGAFKRKEWLNKQGNLNQLLAFKAGLCLPKSCDSIQFKNKYEFIKKIAKFNARKVDDDDEIVLDYLYCLPDDESTLRVWYKSPKTAAFVVALGLWVGLLLIATVKYEKLRRKQDSNKLESNKLTRGEQVYKSLSIINNAKFLFRIAKPSTEWTSSSKGVIIDWSVLEGIKVLALCYIITGHVMLGFTQIFKFDTDHFKVKPSSIFYHSFTFAPAFAVNFFFTITGIMTAYLVFKKTEPIELIKAPVKWIGLIIQRYFRLMPVYVLVTMYMKYLGKYVGSGPFWDYGTSLLSPRRSCEQESWLWILLMGSNFKGAVGHCVVSAWYLACDFQFCIVTPLFLALLQKWPKFGRRFVVGTILVLSLLATWAVAIVDADMRPFVNYMLHGFMTITMFHGADYTMPLYRMPAYLCGILIGFILYRYEQDMLHYLGAQGDTAKQAKIGSMRPDWPRWLKRFGSWLPLVLLTLGFWNSVLGSHLHVDKFYSRIITAALLATFNLLFGLSIGLYVLLVSTSGKKTCLTRFLSSPLWKPLSRLNLCVLLINAEVAITLAQTSTHFVEIDHKTLIAYHMVSIVTSYLVATVIYILFEAPVQVSINKLLGSKTRRLGEGQKTSVRFREVELRTVS